VGKIAEKAVCRSVLTLYFQCKLTKTHSFRLFFGNFAHWEESEKLQNTQQTPIGRSYYLHTAMD